jgi:hypothetical protein
MSAKAARVTPQGLRPLGLPEPVEVRCGEDGEPLAVAPRTRRSGGLLQSAVSVERIEEVWRVSEAWWREEAIARTYFRLVVSGGRPLTVFRDESAGEAGWFVQRY